MGSAQAVASTPTTSVAAGLKSGGCRLALSRVRKSPGAISTSSATAGMSNHAPAGATAVISTVFVMPSGTAIGAKAVIPGTPTGGCITSDPGTPSTSSKRYAPPGSATSV